MPKLAAHAPPQPAQNVRVDIDLTATEAAWKKHEARARALHRAVLNAARIDVTHAAAIAVAGARNVLGQRDQLVEAFCDPELDVIERVHEVALAAQHADLLHRAAQDETAPYADILPRMTELRGCLLDDMQAQVRRKRCPAKTYNDIRAGDGSVRDKANDLNDLAVWYRANWAKVSRKTTVEEEEIAEAGTLATQVLARLGKLIAAQAEKADAMSSAELRRRGFTLLLQDYDVVRRYGAFLFWTREGGWEQFVPSLWAGREGGEGGEDAKTDKAPVAAPAKPPTG